ncbi:hypothetical protein JQ615_31165 [Bradyrhizobium jicamae]|uniref:Uncharacterized protein n=1 Tax=Bradyrhizobium jicamae TaxID=280332 RepID=A0ABS5FSU6_9BRAD|nr:hypothetical protein [Bradyrhizobium jicamae]MBR0799838.1 hypothetical protein [Bradyrhizobium jicamae]
MAEILGTPTASSAYSVMSAEDYLQMAEHCRLAKEKATDDFIRYYLERMEHSYRVLASSEAVLTESKQAQAEMGEDRDKKGS